MLDCIVHGNLLIHYFRSGVIRNGNPLFGLILRRFTRPQDASEVRKPKTSGIAQSKDRTIIFDVRKAEL
jgi:hypothetical protein